jgi:hypothetical protein
MQRGSPKTCRRSSLPVLAWLKSRRRESAVLCPSACGQAGKSLRIRRAVLGKTGWARMMYATTAP